MQYLMHRAIIHAKRKSVSQMTIGWQPSRCFQEAARLPWLRSHYPDTVDSDESSVFLRHCIFTISLRQVVRLVLNSARSLYTMPGPVFPSALTTGNSKASLRKSWAWAKSDPRLFFESLWLLLGICIPHGAQLHQQGDTGENEDSWPQHGAVLGSWGIVKK